MKNSRPKMKNSIFKAVEKDFMTESVGKRMFKPRTSPFNSFTTGGNSLCLCSQGRPWSACTSMHKQSISQFCYFGIGDLQILWTIAVFFQRVFIQERYTVWILASFLKYKTIDQNVIVFQGSRKSRTKFS